MLRHWILLISFIFSFQTSFAEQKFWDVSTDTTTFYSLYAEDGIWRIDSFAQDEEGFLTLIKRQSFSTQEKGQQAFQKLRSSLPDEALRNFYQPASPRLVKGFLWEATEAWSWDWEKKYSEWVRANVNKQFFADYNLPADCADAAFAFRWIFSRINKLPAANHLANGQWMTHETYRKSWSRYPQHQDWKQDQRFWRALNDLLDSTYTHSLMRDSYPVAINPESFREGIHHLHLSGSSGHTRIVNEVNANSTTQIPLKLIWATVPRDLANLSEGGFWDSQQSEKKVSGFFRIRWAVQSGSKWVFAKTADIPHYSEEQFDENFMGEESSFALALIKKISPNFDPVLIYKNGLELVTDSIQQRVKVVADGFAFCSQNDCSEGTENYENWSTPSRDKRLRQNIKELETYLSSISPLTTEPLELYAQTLADSEIEVSGQKYPFSLFRTLWLAKAYSFQPWDPIEKRWPFQSNAFLQQLRDRLDRYMAKREEQISKKEETKEIDKELRILMLNALYYMKNASPQESQLFYQSLQTSTYKGESLLKTLFRTHFYTSDPKDSLQKRWGLTLTNNDFTLHQGLKFYFESDKGFLAREDKEGASLWHMGQMVFQFPKTQHWSYMFAQGEALVTDDTTQTFWIYQGQTPRDLGVPVENNFTTMNNKTLIVGDHILRDEENGMVLYQNALKPYLNHNDYVSQDLFWYLDQGKLMADYYHQGKVETLTLLENNKSDASFSISGLATNGTNTLLQVFEHTHGTSEFYVFNRIQKTFAKRNWNYSFQGRFKDQILLTHTPSQGAFSVRLYDENYNELERHKLPGYASANSSGDQVFIVSSVQAAYIYKHRGDLDFDTIKIPLGTNVQMFLATNEYYAAGKAEGHFTNDFTLYDLATHSPQLTGNWLSVEKKLGQDWFSVYNQTENGYDFYSTWHNGQDWVQFHPNIFSDRENNYTILDPVDGELSYTLGGGIVMSFGTPALFKSLHSHLLHLPGDIVLELAKQ